jgi:imidazolonepropionase-like amidohydrolase
VHRLVIFAFSLFLSTAVYAAQNSFVVSDVRVFTGERVIAHTTVVVRDGRIASVGRLRRIPAGIPVIDGRRRTLIPGLIDSHVHVFPGAQEDALRFGVTTELDMFDVSREFAKWKAQRNSLAPTNSADTWAAGIGVTVPGGAPLGRAAPESVPTLAASGDAQAFVDERVREGSDYIKLFIEDLSEYANGKSLPTLSRNQVCAVVAAAHKDKKLAIVHVQTLAAAKEAVECGADALAHTFPDKIATKDFAARMHARGVFLLSTLAVWNDASGLGMARRLAAGRRVAPYLSDVQKGSLTAADKTTMPQFYPNALATIRRLHRAGVVILAGTDAPNPGTAHGVALHEEMQILVDAGFSPTDALKAATSLPAKIFHLGNRGSIRPGARADLVLVAGDPTKDISQTLSIEQIWKNGYLVNRTPPRT